jgi:SUKH-4 immunity protein of toxin-antitoxin system
MMSDLPETRDLFYPQDPTTVHVGTEQGVRLGRDLGADIVVLDSGAVVAVTESGGALLVNSSLPQYRESLLTVGAARDKFRDEPDADDDVIADVIADLEARLVQIDRQAYTAGDYWKLIVEEIRNEQF